LTWASCKTKPRRRRPKKPPNLQTLLAKLKEALKDKAEDVRVTTRLVDSPPAWWCSDHGMSTQLARMLKQAGQQAPDVKPVLEVNAEHALVKKLDGSVHFNDLAHILFDQALLAEGGLPADPASLCEAGECIAGVVLTIKSSSTARIHCATSYELHSNS
jgi:HSP90 family molecular chaperone